MGNTCAPDHSGAEVVKDMEPSDRLTAIINRYHLDNQRMELELDELKSKSAASCQAYADRTKQNTDLVRELASIRNSVSKKDRSVVRHLLEAALYSTATSLLSEDSISKKIIEGHLKKFGRAGKTKSKGKWVEVYLICGEGSRTQFTKGHLMLMWADSQESIVSSRARVIEVKEEALNVNPSLQGRTFSIVAMVKGASKELVFTCDDEESKQLWVQKCRSALSQIEEEEKYMTELFSLEIEFCKEKLGFRVEEHLVEQKNDTDKSEDKIVETTLTSEAVDPDDPEEDCEIAAKAAHKKDNNKNEDKIDETTPLISEAVEPAENCEIAAKVVQKPKEETEETVEDETICEVLEEKGETVETACGNDFTKTEEKPCELLITSISDQELLSKGLVEYSTLRKINNVVLEGLSFAEQLKILTTTEKPFTLTFTGPMYLKKQLVSTTAYSSILKDLVAEGENTVKSIFYTMVKGSVIEEELKVQGKDSAVPIKALLSNRGRLITLLQNLKDSDEAF